MSIKPLNKETIKLINSTQVISSIYSAVKELVENSLDAQATNIEVNLVDNGLSLIEVKDNGTGINLEDAPYMGLSSCTSKISNFEDLDLLSTYGFRGEGLTAVCQVSNVTVCTKTANDEVVTCYTLDSEGNVTSSDLTHGLTGTTVQMKDLFKNFPVRRNILSNKKRITQEIKAVEILLKTYAISIPGVRFLYRVNRSTVFSKPVCKNISEAVKAVLGVQIFSKLYLLSIDCPEFQLQIFVPKKGLKDGSEVSQPNYQFICVNNRPIKSKEIEKQIIKRISQYFDETESNRKYIFFLLLTVDPSVLDINLEPNKDKVILRNESIIMDEINKCLLSFYELTSSQISTQSDAENINYNGDVAIKEKESSSCKKRKLGPKNQNTHDVNILKDAAQETDLSRKKATAKSNELERMDTLPQALDESTIFDYNQNNEKSNDVVEESLSQLPVVDLGEDFNWEEVVNKSKAKQATCAPNNKEAANNENVSNLIWSKGQVPGLQGGVTVSVLNNKRTNPNECAEKSGEVQEDSEIFDFRPATDVLNDSEMITNDDLPIHEVDKFNWEMEVKNKRRRSPNRKSGGKSGNAGGSRQMKKIDPTQTKIPFAGDNACLTTIGPSAFATFCTEARKDILKKHPEYTPAVVATKLNKQWKEISEEERDYYRDLATQNHKKSLSSQTQSQTQRKPKSQRNEMDKENNKKQLVSMLENMNMNKAPTSDENVLKRRFTVWDTSLPSLAEKFKSSNKKSEKVIGFLNAVLWIVNLNSHLFVFDINDLHTQLNMSYDVNEISEEYVKSILDKWFREKDDMSLFHPLYSMK